MVKATVSNYGVADIPRLRRSWASEIMLAQGKRTVFDDERDFTDAEGSLLTKPPTEKLVARKKRLGSEAVYEALILPHESYVPNKPSRDFTRPLETPSGLKGLLHTLNATMIPMKFCSWYYTVALTKVFQGWDVDVARREHSWWHVLGHAF
ncbi:hypothetical protein Tco_0238213 [Tanacetum coccineum]